MFNYSQFDVPRFLEILRSCIFRAQEAVKFVDEDDLENRKNTRVVLTFINQPELLTHEDIPYTFLEYKDEYGRGLMLDLSFGQGKRHYQFCGELLGLLGESGILGRVVFLKEPLEYLG